MHKLLKSEPVFNEYDLRNSHASTNNYSPIVCNNGAEKNVQVTKLVTCISKITPKSTLIYDDLSSI